MLKLRHRRDDPRPALDRAWATEAHHHLVLSRTIEDRLHALYKQQRVRGRLVSGRGQEAIPVGATMALTDADLVAPVHRDLGAHLVRGTTPLTVFRHYLGRAAGPSQGRDGDIHMGEWSRGVFPMVSHLPDSWPVLNGAALGFKLGGQARVALAFCGDGATSTGTWHESVNFASVLELPIVFVIENNQYAYSTPTDRQFRVARLASRAAAYGIDGESVDGNDVIAVHRAVAAAVDKARTGGGPSIIEALTMRMDGHAVHDGASYVPADLLAHWARRDPIELFERRLLDEGWSEVDLGDTRARLRAEVDEAWRTAEAEPLPDPSTLTHGVFAETGDA